MHLCDISRCPSHQLATADEYYQQSGNQAMSPKALVATHLIDHLKENSLHICLHNSAMTLHPFNIVTHYFITHRHHVNIAYGKEAPHFMGIQAFNLAATSRSSSVMMP